jgi:hypothetical protein
MVEHLLRGGFFAFGILLLLLAVTGIPSFWLLKKRDIGIKAKVLMVVFCMHARNK